MRAVQIQHLRGVLANIPVLAVSEFYLATDTGDLYVGTNSGNKKVASSGSSVSQTEIDFGTTPVAEMGFTIADASVTPASKITGSVAYQAPTGKDLDELEMDELDLKFGPGSGQLTIYARGRDGYIADKFKVNYIVG